MPTLLDVTFYEVVMALIFVGLAERTLLAYAPAEMVGRRGWLIRGRFDE